MLMNEETKNTALEGSAFARVLGRLMESRGITANQEHALELAEKSGLDPETFRARLAGEDANPGDLSRLAGELALSEAEMGVLALAYALEEERELEDLGGVVSPRVARPEEIVETYEEITPDQRARPLRCRGGAKTDSPCPRDAATWLHPEDYDYPLCDEHARANELWMESSEWGIAEEVTGDWLRIARAWRLEGLEQLAVIAHESAKEGFLKADARTELATEIADAPRKGRKDKIAELTPEQDERLRRLINRSDGLVNARTALEDFATGKVPEKNLRRTLAVLVEESERVNEEAHRYSEELGIAVEPKK